MSRLKLSDIKQSDCKQWLSSPFINPITGNKLKKDIGYYNLFKKACERLSPSKEKFIFYSGSKIYNVVDDIIQSVIEGNICSDLLKEQASESLLALDEEEDELLVHYENNRVDGFINFRLEDDEFYIYYICALGNKGLGTKLINKLEEYARKELKLKSFSFKLESIKESMPFYLKLGFDFIREDDLVPFKINDDEIKQWLDKINKKLKLKNDMIPLKSSEARRLLKKYKLVSGLTHYMIKYFD